MNGLIQWQRKNNDALAAELARLRGLLRSAVERASSRDSATVAGDAAIARLAPADLNGAAAAAEPSADGGRGDDVSEGNGFVSGLDLVAARFELSPFERDLLLLTAAVEFDPRIADLCAAVQGDSARRYPTFALALGLLPEPTWDALSPERPLRRLRLVEVHAGGGLPLTAAPLRTDERIMHIIKGLNYLDPRIDALLAPAVDEVGGPLPPSHREQADRIVAQLLGRSSERLPVVHLSGLDAQARWNVAEQVAAVFGMRVLRLPAGNLPSDPGELNTLVRLWERERRLSPVALYLDAAESELPLGGPLSLGRFSAKADGLVFLASDDDRLPRSESAITVDVAKPTTKEQYELWREELGEISAAEELSSHFSLGAATIRRIAAEQVADRTDAKATDAAESQGEPAVLDGAARDRLWGACRLAARPRLDRLARRIEPRTAWDRLVLPPDETCRLQEIVAQVRNRRRVYDEWGVRRAHGRGLGISVMFAGESGTGKTLAAEVLAGELRLDLYRVDLSALVDKYIGETEKNLRRLFDAADDGGAILFFDEADALFGKRSEVKDSHDRYANLEINYLLQRMESYRGVAILATNLKASLDKAFLRRLRFIVDFPMPDAGLRAEMWRKAFPPEMPVSGLSPERLAKLNLSGGNIHSIAMNAAFASAADDSPVTMSHLLSAAQSEYRKLQKPITAADFRLHEFEGAGR